MYRFTKVTIYLRFALIVTIYDIFKLIIDNQVDHQMAGGHLRLLQRVYVGRLNLALIFILNKPMGVFTHLGTCVKLNTV